MGRGGGVNAVHLHGTAFLLPSPSKVTSALKEKKENRKKKGGGGGEEKNHREISKAYIG